MLRRQKPDKTDAPSRLKPVPYSASIVHWHLIGSGDTAAEALADLENTFARQAAERRANNQPLPRPGTHVPIEFAATDRVGNHCELADDFIRRVLELDWAWISDESSLWDFHGEETNDVLLARIMDVYHVDVSDIESAKLCEILERIAQQTGSKA